MKDIFIHVGYPKTGTTFLQQKVFENLKVTKSFGKPKIEENMKFIINSICKDDEITFVNDENGIFPPKNYNDLSYQYCKYQCIPGRLILFSSDLGHCTNPQKSNEKITISFNIGV